MYWQTKSKYHNVRQDYGGYNYASKKEANRAYELDLLVKAKELKKWERQITLPLYVMGQLWRSYRIDFIRYEKTGDIVLEEVKGFETAEYKMKRDILEIIMDNPKSWEYKQIAQKVGAKGKQLILYEVIK
jgi:hypothetical protein